MGDDRADRTLYVGNLETEVTEDILYELFLQCGPLHSVKRIADKPFAFIEFKHDITVPYAKDIMEGTQLFQKDLRIQFRSGSIHTQPSNSPRQGSRLDAEQPQENANFMRSNSYPNSTNMPSFLPQGQDQRHHGRVNHAGQFIGNQQFVDGQRGSLYSDRDPNQPRNYENNFRQSSSQYQKSHSFSDQGHHSHDGGARQDRSNSYYNQDDRHHRSDGGEQRRGHSYHGNDPQTIIQKQMRRSAESSMRYSSGNRGQQHESGSGGHHHRR